MKIAYEPHPVSPERKAELRGQGLKIVDARFAPDGHVVEADGNEPYGFDSGDQFSNTQLRDAIKIETGKFPAGRMSRNKLIAEFNKLNGA